MKLFPGPKIALILTLLLFIACHLRPPVPLTPPDEDRFTKTTLAQGVFTEPTEMTILPNLDILIVQRRGEIMLYKKDSGTVKQAGFLNVYFKALTPKGSTEDGLLGIQADPDYAKNHYIYVFYAPVDTAVDRLSRFSFTNDTLDTKSEKVVLEVHTQREICCHTGGSIAFGKDHELFVSTGDNSTPFDEHDQKYNLHAFAPLDDRPGFRAYDSRRGAGNTNDLRGKIIRIKINPDGGYDIPDGNLFPKGTAKTRPEIYVMGDRNPYRISVDKENGYLYWGEVGPDAQEDSLETRGPRGYDEVNQARKAGNFGWPYFVGNNYPYHEYDFETGKSGPAFDPQKPINNSRNNTGLRELPPAQPAFVWYPYGESKEFPEVGTGGRTAMAGPVYHTELYPEPTRLPDYYDGKFFMYDWIRGWIKVVTMKPNGDFEKMEPFMEHIKLNAPVDMETGPDGKIYILEYGNGWFTKNADAGIARIDYNGGNRPPAIAEFKINKTSGALPFTVSASVKTTDPEKDSVTYIWHIGKDTVRTTKGPELGYTFTTPGEYAIYVEVKDDKNASSASAPVTVYAGNEAPEVNIHIKGNRTFYFPGKAVQYKVEITDKDDTTKFKDPADLFVSAEYTQSADKASAQGHQMIPETVLGKNLMLSLDCKTCHKIAEKSIGPSFTDVAKRYEKDSRSGEHLIEKIKKGGSGVWGEVSMPAHPALKDADVKMILGWIRTLSGTAAKSLPASGSLDPTLKQPIKDKGVLAVSATYTDKGGNNVKPLTGSYTLVLHNSRVALGKLKKKQGFTVISGKGFSYAEVPQYTGWLAIEGIDLTDIRKLSLSLNWISLPVPAYAFELHLDSPEGRKVGELEFKGITGPARNPADQTWQEKNIEGTIEEVKDGELHTLYIVSKGKNATADKQLSLSFIQFYSK
jgi:glucose/arabinose dehydrogenase/cytochrome c551/c552